MVLRSFRRRAGSPWTVLLGLLSHDGDEKLVLGRRQPAWDPALLTWDAAGWSVPGAASRWGGPDAEGYGHVVDKQSY